ncbi:MAG: AAA domain-containing protein [Planctomycetes bacterium]|nr:AAA domain-containing protein [Planctomycetota bacterium]
MVELTRDGFAYRVEGWTEPPSPHPLFIGAAFRPVVPMRTEHGAQGVTVWLTEEVGEGETVYWQGRQVQLVAVNAAWPARLVIRRGGAITPVRERRESPAFLRLIVEGAPPDSVLSEVGLPIAHRVVEPHVGAASLRGQRTSQPWTGERVLTPVTPFDAEILTSDNGVRWSWSEDAGQRRRRGVLIQLLAPDDVDDQATVDPRVAYCEEGVREVRTQKGGGDRNAYRVLGSRRETYRLELDRLPPDGSSVFLPANTHAIQRQLAAVYRLRDSPLPHHRGLLTLCEDPKKVHWARAQRARVSKWYVLDDHRWDGTLEQREFVEKALGTPDFAFLEGPPGSGKTHAICELVLQLICDPQRPQRVLLCSTTHVAVDNVLERLLGKFADVVEAVRIGKAERVDERVLGCQIDRRIDSLIDTWRARGALSGLDDTALERAAEETVLAGANLTCGTTTGILAHPYIRRSDEGSGPRWPYFDVLILDEASKTTLQEFLVPAQLARRWVVVGDVRQLPPFTDPRDLEASLAEVNNEEGARLPDALQRACLLLFRLTRAEAGWGRVRWLIVEPAEVLDALVWEVAARQERDDGGQPELARLVHQATGPDEVAIADLLARRPSSLRVLGADWLLVADADLPRVQAALPPHFVPLRSLGAESTLSRRQTWWTTSFGKLQPPVRENRRKQFGSVEELAAAQQTFLREETWAAQIAWRLGRVHQLSSARNDRDRTWRQEEVDLLMPAGHPFCEWVPPAIDAIRDVGVRSVIESLRVRRVDPRVRKRSALTDAIPEQVWSDRSVLLSRQHRMHPGISELPSKLFYDGLALHDANTLEGRDARIGWGFLGHALGRRVWLDVKGHEERGTNPREVEAVGHLLQQWAEHARTHTRTDDRPWEVACLSFYNRQELALRDELRRLTGHRRGETRFELPNTVVACATVDRFQGREADLVILSLRNTSRPGHMDSPNRLNVAITRARFMLILVGNRRYFAEDCPSEELTALAEQTPVLPREARR